MHISFPRWGGVFMLVSRREFLRCGSFLAAGAILPGALTAQSGRHVAINSDGNGSIGLSGIQGNGALTHPAAAHALLPQWERQSFLRCIGESFSVQSKDNQVWLTLTALTDFPAAEPVNPASLNVPPPKSSAAPVETEAYFLTLHAALSKPLAQGSYSFDHEKMGPFSMFIAPGSDGETYVAVVNRLKSSAHPPTFPGLRDHNVPGPAAPGAPAGRFRSPVQIEETDSPSGIRSAQPNLNRE
jgi:hypothetical protein